MKKFFKKDEKIKEETTPTEPNEDGAGENPDVPAQEEPVKKKKNLKKAFIIGGAAMAGLTIIGGIIKEKFFPAAEPEEEYEEYDGDPGEDSEEEDLDDSEIEEESEEEE